MDMATKRPVGLPKTYLNDEFFQEIISKENLSLVSWTYFPIKIGGRSITSEMARLTDAQERISGVHGFDLKVKDVQGACKSVRILMKSKKFFSEMMSNWSSLITRRGEALQKLVKTYCLRDMDEMHLREPMVAELIKNEPMIQQITHKVYETVIDKQNDIYAYFIEFFEPESFWKLNTEGAVDWNDELRRRVAQDLAAFHAGYLAKFDAILNHLGNLALNCLPRLQMQCMPLWLECLSVLKETHPEVLTKSREVMLRKYLRDLPSITKELEDYPMTFCHGDSYYGNYCMRRSPDEGLLHLCLFDWELSCLNVPQRDLSRMLYTCTIPASSQREHLQIFNTYIDLYHDSLIRILRENHGVNFTEIEKNRIECQENDTNGMCDPFCVPAIHNDKQTPQDETPNSFKDINSAARFAALAQRSKANLYKIMDRKLFQKIFDYTLFQQFFDRAAIVLLLPDHLLNDSLLVETESCLLYLEARENLAEK